MKGKIVYLIWMKSKELRGNTIALTFGNEDKRKEAMDFLSGLCKLRPILLSRPSPGKSMPKNR
jgi:hypothetical protein